MKNKNHKLFSKVAIENLRGLFHVKLNQELMKISITLN